MEPVNWKERAGQAESALTAAQAQLAERDAEIERLKGRVNTDETFWLIERGGAVNHSPTIWYKGGIERSDYANDCTETAVDALRFQSKESAERFAKRCFGETGILTITQHALIK